MDARVRKWACWCGLATVEKAHSARSIGRWAAFSIALTGGLPSRPFLTQKNPQVKPRPHFYHINLPTAPAISVRAAMAAESFGALHEFGGMGTLV
jgi:hypothetical protein